MPVLGGVPAAVVLAAVTGTGMTLIRGLRRLDAAHRAGLTELRGQVERDAAIRQQAQLRQLEAMHQLYAGFRPRAPMPSSGPAALHPADLLALLHVVETRRPAVIVELGSGPSTVWLAYAAQRYGGRVVSLEHDIRYAERARAQVHAHGLDAVAEVRDAPLNQIDIGGTEYDWYDPDALEDIECIGLLLVDGPPPSLGPDARYPALTALKGKLAPGATIVVDDVSHDDDRETVRRWLHDDPALTVEPALLGQHAVLSYGRPPSATRT